MEKGNLFVISGPSGVGKGTLVSRLLDKNPNLWVSLSSTTRSPRPGDKDGVTYDFLDEKVFQERIEKEDFLEWAKYGGSYYGTPKDLVESHLQAGEDVILEIEVQGALQVKEKMPEAFLVFIEPPSMDELEARLRNRGSESESDIRSRLETAGVELSQKMKYDMRLVNDDLDQTTEELAAYMDAQRQ